MTFNPDKTLNRVGLACLGAVAALSACSMPGDPGMMARWGRASGDFAAATHRTAIVLDIDETLSHTDYFDLILQTGRERSRPVRGAREALGELAEHFDLVYLTSRPTYLLPDTANWLEQNGFPPGPVYTADRVAELLNVRRYKTRYLAELQKRHPNACIGIGDRSSDARAYRASGMISIIVNPDGDSHFSSHDVVLRSWADVAGFFEANAGFLGDLQRIRSAVREGRCAFEMPADLRLVRYDDVDDDHGRGKLNRALVKVFPNLRDDAEEQASGAAALRADRDLGEALRMAADRWPEARLADVGFARSGEETVARVELIDDDRLVEAAIDAENGRVLWTRDRNVPGDRLRAASAAATNQTGFDNAIDVASRRVDGRAYRARLRMKHDRPTYEICLLSRRGFWEVDVDARTGEIREVEREWRLVPLR